MQVSIRLFGAFRELHDREQVDVTVPDGGTLDDVRDALCAYADAHWPAFAPGLLQRSAFASDEAFLHRHSPIPSDGRLALVPPVSGG